MPKGEPVFDFSDPVGILFGNAPLYNFNEYFSEVFIKTHMGRRQHYYDLDMTKLLKTGNTLQPGWGIAKFRPPGSGNVENFIPLPDIGLWVRVSDVVAHNANFTSKKAVIMAFNPDGEIPTDFDKWSRDSFAVQWIGVVPPKL